MRWCERHLPAAAPMTARCGSRRSGSASAVCRSPGRSAREVLGRLTHADVSAAAFRFMAIRRMEVGLAPCLVGTGQLHRRSRLRDLDEAGIPAPCLRADHAGGRAARHPALRAARAERHAAGEELWRLGARVPAALRAASRPGWTASSPMRRRPTSSARQAALAERETGGRLRLRAFRVEARDADVIGDEPIWLDGGVVGWVTSGGYAHNSRVSMALGYVPKEHADAEGPWADRAAGRAPAGGDPARARLGRQRQPDAGIGLLPPAGSRRGSAGISRPGRGGHTSRRSG